MKVSELTRPRHMHKTLWRRGLDSLWGRRISPWHRLNPSSEVAFFFVEITPVAERRASPMDDRQMLCRVYAKRILDVLLYKEVRVPSLIPEFLNSLKNLVLK